MKKVERRGPNELWVHNEDGTSFSIYGARDHLDRRQVELATDTPPINFARMSTVEQLIQPNEELPLPNLECGKADNDADLDPMHLLPPEMTFDDVGENPFPSFDDEDGTNDDQPIRNDSSSQEGHLPLPKMTF